MCNRVLEYGKIQRCVTVGCFAPICSECVKGFGKNESVKCSACIDKDTQKGASKGKRQRPYEEESWSRYNQRHYRRDDYDDSQGGWSNHWQKQGGHQGWGKKHWW